MKRTIVLKRIGRFQFIQLFRRVEPEPTPRFATETPGPIKCPVCDRIDENLDGRVGRLAMKPSVACSISIMALCLMLAACNGPTKSAVPLPSAHTFHVEILEVRVGEAIEKVNGAAVTSAFFREAKVLPLLGRAFLDEEYQTASAGVVVMAASLWQRRFGGDPALIGKILTISERQYTIVGILPKTFQFPTGVELWMPQNR